MYIGMGSIVFAIGSSVRMLCECWYAFGWNLGGKTGYVQVEDLVR